MHPNQVNGVLRARIKGLRYQLEESSYIDHSATKGTLREKYLTEFLKNTLPQGYIVSGGFICDVTGRISLQQDLLLSDHTTTPLIFLSKEITLVPVEVAISAVEVKSILNNSDFDQIDSQVKSIKSLQPIAEENLNGTHGVRHFVFAYESQISGDGIKDWFQKIPRLFGVCIFGNAFHYRSSASKIQTIDHDNYSEVLVFVSSLIHSIVKAEKERSPNTSKINMRSNSLNVWRRYITGVNPENIIFP